jgi:hypothetical protein
LGQALAAPGVAVGMAGSRHSHGCSAACFSASAPRTRWCSPRSWRHCRP